jgi:hypothetical protein
VPGTAAVHYAEGLPEAAYTVLTPYVVPAGPKRVNAGDGFILDSVTKLLGARPQATFSAYAPLDERAIERINASRALVVAGANTLRDDFAPALGFDLALLGRLRVPVILMGLGHCGVAHAARGLTPRSQELVRALLGRFPWMSVRCAASRDYVLASAPDLAERVIDTSCPVVHAVDGIDRGFRRGDGLLVATLTDREHLEAQLPLLAAAARFVPAHRRVLALHQDFGNATLEAHARALGYEVFRAADHQEFLRLYEKADLHIGNRVHAHLKCLSLGVRSFCTPFDLRQAYFAQSLDYPLLERLPDALLESYDFTRAAHRRDVARGAMDRFVARVRELFP